MGNYSIGEICRFLLVKPHVLRYWEQEVDFLSPRKNTSGHRIYSQRDLQLLMRLKYLVYERGFTLEGARNKIWGEMTGENANTRGKINQIRDQLMDLLTKIKKTPQ